MSVFRTSLVVRRVVSVTLVVIVSVTLYSTPKPSPLGLGPRRLGRGSRPVAAARRARKEGRGRVESNITNMLVTSFPAQRGMSEDGVIVCLAERSARGI